MAFGRTLGILLAAAFVSPVLAGPVRPTVPANERVIVVQGKGEEHGKQKAKGKAKQEETKKNAGRSNKGGETRGAERSDQVQGMQDKGKGAGKRP
jgi:hypothetical protein